MTRSPRAWFARTLTVLLAAACTPAAERKASQGPVKLIVLISVDQLPTYLLERYDSLYSGGLRRLIDEGRNYRRAVHDHALTVTAAGHATLATGLTPARHGIVANEWYERVAGEWAWVKAVEDPAVEIIGLPYAMGQSPARLRAEALGDWLTASDPDAQLLSISGKERPAILMVGRSRGHVYWFEDDVGRFVTSSWYRTRYPDWVDHFNTKGLSEFYTDSTWELSVADVFRPLARGDTASFEYDGTRVTFPHRFLDQVGEHAASDPGEYYDWWAHTPELDRAILAFAREAVRSLSLGGRGSIDYLALGLSQLDRVGHRFGPFSLEQLDALLRLDRALGAFFDFLDETVGEGRYLVGFSADHGALPIPEYLIEQGKPGRRISRDEVRAMRRLVQQTVETTDRPQARLIEALEGVDFVADVMGVDELAGGTPADSFVALHQRSYYPGRVAGWLGSLGLVIRYIEGAHSSADATTHGTCYYYDRHVPLIFMGPGVPSGATDEAARTVDMAPTLAALAGVPYPAGLDGRPLIVAIR